MPQPSPHPQDARGRLRRPLAVAIRIPRSGSPGSPSPELYIIPPMSGMPPPAPPRRVLLGRLGDDRLGGEDVLRDRRGVLQRRAGDHRRVDDPGLDEVLDLAGVDVQALARLRRADLVDDDRALEARVRRELAERLLERADDDLRARPLVALERRRAASLTVSAAFSSATPPPGTMPSSRAARVACSASSTRCFFSFISVSVAAPTLTTATPPDSFASRSWSFSRSKSESVFSISALSCLIRRLDRLARRRRRR